MSTDTETDTITDEQVAAIADRMVQQGRRVSPVTIWKEVRGGTLVSIVAALQRWREARHADIPQAQVQPGLPERLAETVISAADRIWVASQHDAEQAFNQRLATLAEDLEAALAERDEALAEYQKTNDEIEAGRHRLTDVMNELSAAESATLRLKAELANAVGRAEAAEMRVGEMAQRASTQDAELDAMKASLEEERRAREEWAATLARKDDEIAQLTRERDQARRDIATLSDACQAKTEEATHASQEASAAVSRAEALQARVDDLVQRASADETKAAATNALLEDERKAREELAAIVASKDDEITRVTHARDLAQQEVAALRDDYLAKSQEVAQREQEASEALSRAESAEGRVAELVQRVSTHEASLEAARSSLVEESKAREELASIVALTTDELTGVTQERDLALLEISSLREAHEAKTQEANAAFSRAQAADARVEELTARASADHAAHEATKASLEKERQAREDLTAIISDKDNELIRVANERDQAQHQIATLTSADEARQEEVARLSAEISAVSSRAEAAEAHASENLARIRELQAELERAHDTLMAERKAAEAQADETSDHLAELRRVTEELEETRQQLISATEAKTLASANVARLSQDASVVRERAESAERHVAQLEQRVAAQAASIAQHLQHARELEARADEAGNAEEIAALQRQMAAQAKAHAKALGELRATAEQWVVHAKDLKQRLGLASERILFIDARSTGEVALVRRLSSELERLKPDHELISREAQQKLIGATMTHQLAQKGYRYDPATAAMSKVAT